MKYAFHVTTKTVCDLSLRLWPPAYYHGYVDIVVYHWCNV